MQAGLVFFTTKGSWTLSDDTLHLFSEDIPKNKQAKIEQISMTDNSIIKIVVTDSLQNKIPINYGHLKRSGDTISTLIAQTDGAMDTLFIGQNELYDTLEIYPFSYDFIKLTKSQTKPGVVRLTVFQTPMFYFDNKKFIIKNRKLIEVAQQNETALKLKLQ
jgi:hypothetical protein